MANQAQTFSEATNLFGRSVDFTNFVLDNWPLWVLVLAATWLLLTLRAKHELLGELDERCEAAFADMDALLAERHALIPNLVETVKAFAAQEHTVLKDVIDARARATSATGAARLDAEARVGQALANVWDIAESYPELASSTHFRERGKDHREPQVLQPLGRGNVRGQARLPRQPHRRRHQARQSREVLARRAPRGFRRAGQGHLLEPARTSFQDRSC